MNCFAENWKSIEYISEVICHMNTAIIYADQTIDSFIWSRTITHTCTAYMYTIESRPSIFTQWLRLWLRREMEKKNNNRKLKKNDGNKKSSMSDYGMIRISNWMFRHLWTCWIECVAQTNHYKYIKNRHIHIHTNYRRISLHMKFVWYSSVTERKNEIETFRRWTCYRLYRYTILSPTHTTEYHTFIFKSFKIATRRKKWERNEQWTEHA